MTGTHRELSGLNALTLTEGQIGSSVQSYYNNVYGNACSPWLSYTTCSQKRVENSKCTKGEWHTYTLHVTMGVTFLLLKEYTKLLFIGNKQNSCSNNCDKFMH